MRGMMDAPPLSDNWTHAMIALPKFFCPKLWEDMTGNETERFCGKCGKTVHNIESLSLDQRLALLHSPKGSICGRYRIAVCRARPGYEQSYMQHLLRYGAGVAVSSAAFITLWQMYDDGHRKLSPPMFRVGKESAGCGGVMPEEFYEEHSTATLGIVVVPRLPVARIEGEESVHAPIEHVDISLEPIELEKLIKMSAPHRLEVPPMLLPENPKVERAAILPPSTSSTVEPPGIH